MVKIPVITLGSRSRTDRPSVHVGLGRCALHAWWINRSIANIHYYIPVQHLSTLLMKKWKTEGVLALPYCLKYPFYNMQVKFSVKSEPEQIILDELYSHKSHSQNRFSPQRKTQGLYERWRERYIHQCYCLLDIHFHGSLWYWMHGIQDIHYPLDNYSNYWKIGVCYYWFDRKCCNRKHC